MKNTDEAQKIISYKHAFAGEHGERVLADLRRLSTYDRSAVSAIDNKNPIPIDPLRLAFQEGQRSVIVYILRKLKQDAYKE